MSNVKLLPTKNSIPPDTPVLLRALADRCERGEITSLVIALTADDSYEFIFPSSLNDSLVLADLLHAKCVNKFNV